jgi:hypothetical protein
MLSPRVQDVSLALLQDTLAEAVLRQNLIGARFHSIRLLAVHNGDGARQLQESE